jgi:undecaprenyl-diphosphatase
MMNWIEALILGIIQGLTEFLPVSSSGHLELGKTIFHLSAEDDMTFAVVVHGATVLSTIVVFYKELGSLLLNAFSFRWNDSTKYVLKLIISMIPVVIVGFFFRDFVEQFFTGNVVFVGSMLIVTAALLILTSFAKDKGREIGYLDSFIIGIAQAIATLPGISRSGATISTGLLLGNKKDEMARFSFLMVLIPIIGVNFLDIISGDLTADNAVSIFPLIVGFLSAFVTGLFACRWMISLVKKGKLIYFGLYCLVIGLIAILTGI